MTSCLRTWVVCLLWTILSSQCQGSYVHLVPQTQVAKWTGGPDILRMGLTFSLLLLWFDSILKFHLFKLVWNTARSAQWFKSTHLCNKILNSNQSVKHLRGCFVFESYTVCTFWRLHFILFTPYFSGYKFNCEVFTNDYINDGWGSDERISWTSCWGVPL